MLQTSVGPRLPKLVMFKSAKLVKLYSLFIFPLITQSRWVKLAGFPIISYPTKFSLEGMGCTHFSSSLASGCREKIQKLKDYLKFL